MSRGIRKPRLGTWNTQRMQFSKDPLKLKEVGKIIIDNFDLLCLQEIPGNCRGVESLLEIMAEEGHNFCIIYPTGAPTDLLNGILFREEAFSMLENSPSLTFETSHTQLFVAKSNLDHSTYCIASVHIPPWVENEQGKAVTASQSNMKMRVLAEMWNRLCLTLDFFVFF